MKKMNHNSTQTHDCVRKFPIMPCKVQTCALLYIFLRLHCQCCGIKVCNISIMVSLIPLYIKGIFCTLIDCYDKFVMFHLDELLGCYCVKILSMSTVYCKPQSREIQSKKIKPQYSEVSLQHEFTTAPTLHCQDLLAE